MKNLQNNVIHCVDYHVVCSTLSDLLCVSTSFQKLLRRFTSAFGREKFKGRFLIQGVSAGNMLPADYGLSLNSSHYHGTCQMRRRGNHEDFVVSLCHYGVEPDIFRIQIRNFTA